MQPNYSASMFGLLDYALKSGLVKNGEVELAGKSKELEVFGTLAIRASKKEVENRREVFDAANVEDALRREAGELDTGWDTDDELEYAELSYGGVAMPVTSTVLDNDGNSDADTCFAIMCKYMGVVCAPHTNSVIELSKQDQEVLRNSDKVMVAYDWYAQDDPRNHVVAVVKGSNTSVVTVSVAGGDGTKNCIHGVTSPQEFFNPGGRFYNSRFYTTEQRESSPRDDEFGGDISAPASRSQTAIRSDRQVPQPPESVVNGGASAGAANITGGVIRPKRRAIKARGSYDVTAKTLRNYSVVGVTMFNNAEELFLNTVSREYAQEIIEDLFEVWELPTDEAATMKYAEDLLWTFLVARTASNKADYRVALDVPTSKGSVEVNFDKFSRLLADRYGITRRNFARGVSDDLREFLCREENQFLRSRAAQRIGADPQMGGLCFDGSTGCSGLTSAEMTFTRLLEARNLYERDDVIAEGASDRLMQGVHGGVRSIVPR